MKKLIIPALLFAGAMSSCSKNDVTQVLPVGDTDAIGLNMASGITKGAPTTTATLEQNDMLVDLYTSNTSYNKLEFKYTSTATDKWGQNSTTITWDQIDVNTTPVSFFSVHNGTAPQTLTVTGSGDDATVTAVLNTAFSQDANGNTHKDLVYHGSKLSDVPLGAKISAYHKHALSKIEIYANTGDNKAYIARVRMVNVDNEAKLTINNVNEVTEWSDLATQTAFYNYYPAGNTLNSSAANFDAAYVKANPFTVATVGSTDYPKIATTSSTPSILMIPQSLTGITQTTIDNNGPVSGSTTIAGGAYIEIIYRLQDKDSKDRVGCEMAKNHPRIIDGTLKLKSGESEDQPLYVMVAFPIGDGSNAFDFLYNTAYSLNLGLGADETTGGLVLNKKYVDEEGNEITEEEDDQIPEVSEPLFPDPANTIGLTISVMPWEKVTTDSDDLGENVQP